MNVKLRNCFLASVFFIYICVATPLKTYAVQGQLNYDINGLPQEIVTVQDTKAIQECQTKLDTANRSNTELLNQKNQCLQTNSLLNKTMKEAVDQTVKQNKIYRISLLIVGIIAGIFFITTLVLMFKKKGSAPTPILPDQTTTEVK